jgi:hypothetical protein
VSYFKWIEGQREKTVLKISWKREEREALLEMVIRSVVEGPVVVAEA